MDLLRRTIGGYIRHPNTAAALVIAQGYEANDSTTSSPTRSSRSARACRPW